MHSDGAAVHGANHKDVNNLQEKDDDNDDNDFASASLNDGQEIGNVPSGVVADNEKRIKYESDKADPGLNSNSDQNGGDKSSSSCSCRHSKQRQNEASTHEDIDRKKEDGDAVVARSISNKCDLCGANKYKDDARNATENKSRESGVKDGGDNKFNDERESFLGRSEREDGGDEAENENSRCNSSDDESTNSNNSNMDRGYAWVVVVAVFLIHFLHIGYVKAGGIYFVEFQRRFHSNASMTSLVIGLSEVFFSICAPLVLGVLVNYWSIRQISLLGSLFLVAGVIGNAACDSIGYLIITHSLGFGIAKALLLGPSFVIINDYFLKRRALATTIATTGSSVGGFVFPFLARIFFDNFAFVGGVLLTGGVLMHSFIGSALMIPISKLSGRNDSKLNMEEIEASEYSRNQNGSEEKENEEMVSKIDNEYTNIHQKVNNQMYSPQRKYLDVGRNDCTIEVEEAEAFDNAHCETHKNCRHLGKQIKKSSFDDNENQHNTRHRTHSIHSQNQSVNNCNESCNDIHETLIHKTDHNKLDVFHSHRGNPASKKYNSQQSLSRSILYHSTSTLNNTMADILTIDHDLKQTDTEKPEDQNVSTVRKLFPRLCTNPMLRSATFWILVPFYFAGTVAAGLPQIYFMPLAKERGLTDEDAALCLSTQNVMDIIAHILPGVILNNGTMKSTTVSILPMALTWILGHLTSFFHSFETLMMMSVVYGMFVGFFFALQSLYVIDTLGVQNYSFSMGFYYLVMGVGGAASFPIAGALRDMTGTYSTTFHYLASLQCLCLSILLVLPLVRRYDVRRGILPPD